MSSISSFSGLASGVQWGDLVDQMMSIEFSRRLTPIKTEVAARQGSRIAWSTYQSLLTKLTSTATPLRDQSAFNTLQTSVGAGPAGKTLLSANVSAAATPGSYSVEVGELARADKISGAPLPSLTTQLGISGEFYVNGRKVELAGTDSLSALRDKINAVNSGSNASGVTATILSTSPTQNRLVLTSENTGVRGIELVDGDSGVLVSLGVLDGTTSVNASPVDPTRTDTQRFTSTTSALATMLGVTAPPASTTIVIDGHKIEVDLLTDTLLTVMNKLQVAGGAGAITDEVVAGKTFKRLSIEGTVSADPTATDVAASQRIVELMGFVKGDNASTITTGRDSLFQIDDFSMSRRTNTVSDAVPGLTLNLLAEDAAAVTVDVSRNLDATVTKVQEFAAAYNELVSFVEKQRDPTASLYANGTLRSMQRSITGVFLTGVAGLAVSNPYSRAALAGVTLAKAGSLEVDATKLRSALSTNLSDVQALFGTAGTATDGRVSYVASTAKSQPGNYAIDITAAATQATHLGTVVGGGTYTAFDGISDVLTITDVSTGKTTNYTAMHGATLAQLVTGITSAFANEGLNMTVEEESGGLRFSSSDYGTAITFTLGGAATTGLGLTAGTYAGSDVAGTIGGLAAVGTGRILTGATGEVTEGIAVRYSGTGTGAAGNLSYVLGVSGMIDRITSVYNRAGDGTIASQLGSIDASIETLNRRASDVEARLQLRRESISQQFIRMEQAMSILNAQSSWLSGQVAAMNRSTE